MIYVFNDNVPLREEIASIYDKNGYLVEQAKSPGDMWNERFSNISRRKFMRSIAEDASLVVCDWEMGDKFIGALKLAQFLNCAALKQYFEKPVAWIYFYSSYEMSPDRKVNKLTRATWYSASKYSAEELFEATKPLILTDRL